MRLGSFIFNNFPAKLIALVLAIATWFYVNDLVRNDTFPQKQETVEDVFSRYRFITKEVPVKLVFSGAPPEGYRVAREKIIIDPPKITICAPEELIEDVEELRTDRIDLGEYTRSVKLSLGLHSGVKFLRFRDKAVDVYLPVEAVKKEKVPQSEGEK